MPKPLFLKQVAHKPRLELAWTCRRVMTSGECFKPIVMSGPDPWSISPEVVARRYAATFAGEARVTVAVEVSPGHAVFFEARRQIVDLALGIELVALAPEEPEPEDQPLRRLADELDDTKQKLYALSHGIRAVMVWPEEVGAAGAEWVPVVVDLLKAHCANLETERTDAQQSVARLQCERDRAFQRGLIAGRSVDWAVALDHQLASLKTDLRYRDETIRTQGKRLADLMTEGKALKAQGDALETELGGREEFLRGASAMIACTETENVRLRKAMPDAGKLRAVASSQVTHAQSDWSDWLLDHADAIDIALKPEKEPNHDWKIGPFAS